MVLLYKLARNKVIYTYIEKQIYNIDQAIYLSSICLFIYVSIYPFIYLTIYLPISLHILHLALDQHHVLVLAVGVALKAVGQLGREIAEGAVQHNSGVHLG